MMKWLLVVLSISSTTMILLIIAFLWNKSTTTIIETIITTFSSLNYDTYNNDKTNYQHNLHYYMYFQMLQQHQQYRDLQEQQGQDFLTLLGYAQYLNVSCLLQSFDDKQQKIPFNSNVNNNKDIPHPKENDIIHLNDNVDNDIVSFIELPSDTIYVESVAHSNNDNGEMYIVIQRPKRSTEQQEQNHHREIESYVYRIRLIGNDNDSTVSHKVEYVIGPLYDPTNTTSNLSIWGTELLSLQETGILLLFVAVYNRNSIMIFDIDSSKNNIAIQEIKNIAAPNDLALSSYVIHNNNNNDNEQYINISIYVAGGTYENITYPIKTIFSNPTRGQLYRINVSMNINNIIGITTYDVEVLVTNLNTLVGIEVVNSRNDNNQQHEQVWISQGYNIIKYDIISKQIIIPEETTPQWNGYINNDYSLFGKVWLADNIDQTSNSNNNSNNKNRYIITPITGSPEDVILVEIAKNICLATAFILGLNVDSSTDKENAPLSVGLLDPEVDLSYSNTYINNNEDEYDSTFVRFVLLQNNNNNQMKQQQAYHFELDLFQTNLDNPPYDVIDPYTGEVLGQRQYYNNQVTHLSHIQPNSNTEDDDNNNNNEGYFIFINFEVPRIMLLKDYIVFDAIDKQNESYTLGSIIASIGMFVLSIFSFC